jgi:Uma2 family endonuclease
VAVVRESIDTMATAPQLISLDEYLHTSYSPDREYVDGFVVERSLGQGKHAYTQTMLSHRLNDLLIPKGWMALVEQRVKVAPLRVRIPDICVLLQLEDVVTAAPRLCIEVLSPDDRWNRVNERIRDFQAIGVECIWVIDPWARRAWIFQDDRPPQEVHDARLVAERLGIEVAPDDILPG